MSSLPSSSPCLRARLSLRVFARLVFPFWQVIADSDSSLRAPIQKFASAYHHRRKRFRHVIKSGSKREGSSSPSSGLSMPSCFRSGLDIATDGTSDLKSKRSTTQIITRGDWTIELGPAGHISQICIKRLMAPRGVTTKTIM
jgi:hypothetical protein